MCAWHSLLSRHTGCCSEGSQSISHRGCLLLEWLWIPKYLAKFLSFLSSIASGLLVYTFVICHHTSYHTSYHSLLEHHSERSYSSAMMQTLYRRTDVLKSIQIYVNTDGLCEQCAYVTQSVPSVCQTTQPGPYARAGCETWETTRRLRTLVHSFLNIMYVFYTWWVLSVAIMRHLLMHELNLSNCGCPGDTRRPNTLAIITPE